MNLLGSALTSITPRKDDTLVDRLNYYYSAIIIIGISVTLTAKQYVGQPIQCWVPAEFSKAWEQYAENYCFVYNTYWVRPNEEVPAQVNDRVSRQLLYYQWVPFLMALQAGFFYLPVLFWSQTNRRSGLKIASMVETVEQARQSGPQSIERRKAVLTVSQHLEESVRLRQMRKQSVSKIEYKIGVYSGGHVANMYLITKILYLLNIIGQFLVMNMFLGQNDPAWGARILWDIISENNWELSGNFPRVALCDFTVRTLSNVQRYSIQCVLVLNMFNEKIFLFLYWWFILVGLLTAIEAINWALNTRMSNMRISYMKKLVRVPCDQEYLFREFSDRMIGPDGTLLLRMIGNNGNELFAQEVVELLWDSYRAESQLRQVLTIPTNQTSTLRKSIMRRKNVRTMRPNSVRPIGRIQQQSSPGSSSYAENNNNNLSSTEEHNQSGSVHGDTDSDPLLLSEKSIERPKHQANQKLN